MKTRLRARQDPTRIQASLLQPIYTVAGFSHRRCVADVCFYSDVVEELDAAEAAGMDTILMVTPSNPPIAPADHLCHRKQSTLA